MDIGALKELEKGSQEATWAIASTDKNRFRLWRTH